MMIQRSLYFSSKTGRTQLFRLLGKVFNNLHSCNIEPRITSRNTEVKDSSFTGSRRNFLIQSIMALASIYTAPVMATRKKENPRIAIVGAGIAGLNAAYILKQSGYHATVFEASQRTGGRIRTVRDAIAPGIVTELGGEFIDSTHSDVLALAKAFNLPLLDTQIIGGRNLKTTYFFGNQHYTEEQVIDKFKPIASRISSDVMRLSSNITAQNHNKIDVEFDVISISEYLDRIGATGWIRDLIQVAYVTEYGLDASELSCINLLSLIDTSFKDGFQIFGDSDERYKIQDGNQRITDELTKRIGTDIGFEHRLVSMRKNEKGFRLVFTTSSRTVSVNVDWVILALPYTLLREVDTGDVLTPAELDAVQNLGYGTNTKLVLGVNKRIWREQGYSGECYSDEAFQTGWDSSRLQAGPSGSYTLYFGGKSGVEIGNGAVDEHAQQLSTAINRAYPGFAMHHTNTNFRIHWSSEPFARGSYSSFRPGQWTRFNGKIGQQSGNLLFAGEHCSIQFQGYMNGAAETGRLAAQAIINTLR